MAGTYWQTSNLKKGNQIPFILDWKGGGGVRSLKKIVFLIIIEECKWKYSSKKTVMQSIWTD